MTANNNYDVIIVGGSYAGLSAAMSLGRSLRKVLVIDSGKPCNWQTPHSHNFITHDGKIPAEISAIAREQVQQYDTVQFHYAIATTGRKTDTGFEIETDTGKTFNAKKLIFATGIKDIIPDDIKGLAECWGITAIHCPYCHGYEFRGKETAIMASGERAMHLASMVSNLTPKLSIITPRVAELSPEQRAKLQSKNIPIIDAALTEVKHDKGIVNTLVFADGSSKQVDALYVALQFKQHCNIPETLGCKLTEQGHIKINHFQQTGIAGLYACGDNTSPMRSVANAVALGNFTGAIVNKELCEEEFKV